MFSAHKETTLGAVVSRLRPTEAAGTSLLIVAAWVLLIITTSMFRVDFLSYQTLLAVAFTMSVTGVLAVGSAIVTLSGGTIDLSVPTNIVLPAYAVVSLLGAGVPEIIAIPGSIVVGVLWGAFNAAIIVFGKLNPIIVTLATNFLGIAALLLTFQIARTPTTSALYEFGRGFTLGLPNTFWPMVALILITGFLLPRTRIGRRTIAVGGNPAAAKMRGISLAKTRFATFMFSGACGGLAGVLYSASYSALSPNDGVNFLLPVIAAVILAGFPLRGGKGHVWVLFLSVGFLATVPTALVFFGLSSEWQMVVQGLILVIAISLDSYREKRSAR